ncbi:MAG TPA: beta-lactamase family protein, partial [Candidatus Brachybacterium merdigallinarum]|nr:beta-lactamase family protein [Candidatus Brachybacterium merdigallinarum]
EMARYLGATADGSAPGSAAATEVLFTGTEDSAGAMNWFQQDFGTGTMMTFHNGQTGGYFSFVGFDPATGRGIVLLTDTAASLDVLGVGILTGEVAL